MDVLDYKESWVPKNWCFWTVVLEKTLEGPLDCKDIQPVNPKGNQSWIFIGRTDAEAEMQILWPPHAKSWLIGKDPDPGRDWGQEKGVTEDEMAGWHHRLHGHGFGWTPGVVMDREAWHAAIQRVTKSDMTEWLNWTKYQKRYKWEKSISYYPVVLGKTLQRSWNFLLDLEFRVKHLGEVRAGGKQKQRLEVTQLMAVKELAVFQGWFEHWVECVEWQEEYWSKEEETRK